MALLAVTCLANRAVAQSGAPKVELTVAAAASLKDALTVIGKNYRKLRPNVKLNFNFGSSGTLQHQIEQGAPVDLFISAADKNLNELAQQKLIVASSRRVLAGNRLVLIVPKNSRVPIRGFRDVAASRVSHVAIGGPTVPAGMRAEEVFTRLGIWPQVRAKAVRGKDVREVLTQVELGNVEAGVVYRTDAAVSKRVRVVVTAPTSLHKYIRYPFALVADSRNPASAREFSTYLTSRAAKDVLKRYQFLVK
jgi:molybdate transport system substrate-binding protein